MVEPCVFRAGMPAVYQSSRIAHLTAVVKRGLRAMVLPQVACNQIVQSACASPLHAA